MYNKFKEGEKVIALSPEVRKINFKTYLTNQKT
jgi:hypothetical protein